ncbi:replication factor C small subunit [Candidatus Bathyarchaeota archaeon]|nr:replication factor C small subunit [Candidatus Bathyarchaeota archaeon]
MSELWSEKYRPRSLKEMVDQREIVERLMRFVETRSMPHCLFAGPPGTGKTTAALCLARDLFGSYFADSFMELNASVAPETPVLVRINGEIHRTNFKELDALFFGKDCDARYCRVSGLEVLSLSSNDYGVRFLPVSFIARHKAKRLIRIRYEGGAIRVTPSHSVMVINDKGEIEAKKAEDLKKGDLLISFVSNMSGKKRRIDISAYKPSEFSMLNGKLVRNPKIRLSMEQFELTPDTSWLLGAYLAEGCTGFRSGTSGSVILTFAYPQEIALAERTLSIANRLGLSSYVNLTSSGFDRTRYSAIQVRLLNTQLARFFRESFYSGGSTARYKRVPNFMFDASVDDRIEFLKGYMNDGFGVWGEYVRICSVSKELLIDIAWLARLSGIDSSVFEQEVRFIWKGTRFSYTKAELLPSAPFITFFEDVRLRLHGNWRNVLRHQLYSKKARRVSKEVLKKVMDMIDLTSLSREDKKRYERLKRLVESDLYAVRITEVSEEFYDGWVYDFGVPGSETFFGGTTPVLLHNSDERGINVIRDTVKRFARSRSLADVPFKILVLDEADHLTADAQHALRRTMEKYTDTCRFILSCNYSSRIIEPIQSRCAIFRFTPLPREDTIKFLKRIAEAEGVKLLEDGVEAIADVAAGDLRRAINLLQAAAATKEVVDSKVVYDVVGLVHPKRVAELLNTVVSGDLVKARDELRRLLYVDGYSGSDIIRQIHSQVFRLNLPEHLKVQIIELIGETDFRISQGGDEEVQIMALLARIRLAALKGG